MPKRYYARNHGGGILGDMWDKFKEKKGQFANHVWGSVINPVLKQSKFLSNTANSIPVVGSMVSEALKKKGYGRRRKAPRRRGGAILRL